MSSAFFRDEQPEAISEVNVVPLADVSLVLLIILLVLSPMMRQSMLHVRSAGEAARPRAPAPDELLAPRPPELVLVVALTPEGFRLAGRAYATGADVAAALREQLAGRADKKVFLMPHPESTVELVVRALETVKGAGADSVALVQVQEGLD